MKYELGDWVVILNQRRGVYPKGRIGRITEGRDSLFEDSWYRVVCFPDEEDFGNNYSDDQLRPASYEEIENHLNEEAERRGYTAGTGFLSLYPEEKGNVRTISENAPHYLTQDHKGLCAGRTPQREWSCHAPSNPYIYFDGVWAAIVAKAPEFKDGDWVTVVSKQKHTFWYEVGETYKIYKADLSRKNSLFAHSVAVDNDITRFIHKKDIVLSPKKADTDIFIGDYEVVFIRDDIHVGCKTYSKTRVLKTLTLMEEAQISKIKIEGHTITRQTIEEIIKRWS